MYDLIIIGAGPGGYPAAALAAKNGLKVAVIEKENLGGICLNWGCIPSKSLLKAAEIINKIKKGKQWGIDAKYSIDLEVLIKQSRETVEKLNQGINGLFKSNKIELIKEHANIKHISQEKIILQCETKEIEAKNIIIATGSRTRKLPSSILTKEAEQLIWYAKDAMTPKFIPKNIAIIGAGAIGIEFANFYSAIGAKTSLFEMARNILPSTDLEIATIMEAQLKEQNVTLNLNFSINKIEIKNGKFLLNADNAMEFDAVISAIGIVPNTENFELDKENGFIKTNINHQVSINDKIINNLYAIGDCTFGPWLAHKATMEGIRATKHILGKKLAQMSKVPLCIYTSPQIATIGETQEELQAKHGQNFNKNIKIVKSYFRANGKAVAIHEPQGMVKLLFDKHTQELLGAHMLGADVTELIHSLALGMKLEALPQDWAETIFPHPTLSETIWEAFCEFDHECD